MAEYDDLMEKARALGKAIADTRAVRELHAVQTKIENDDELRKLRDDHREIAIKLAKLEMENQPIEPEDKRKLSELQSRMRTDLVFQEQLRLEVEHNDLMRRVNQEISSQLRR